VTCGRATSAGATSTRGLGHALRVLRDRYADASPWPGRAPAAFLVAVLGFACGLQRCAGPRGAVQLTGEHPRLFVTQTAQGGGEEPTSLDLLRDRALGPDQVLDTGRPDGAYEITYGRLRRYGDEWLRRHEVCASDASAGRIAQAAAALAFLHMVEASDDLQLESPFGAKALQLALALCDSLSPHSASAWVQDLRNSHVLYALALVYDWTFPLLNHLEAEGSSTKATIATEMDSLAAWLIDFVEGKPCLDSSNHCHQNAMAVGLAGLSLLDESPEDPLLSRRARSFVKYANGKFLRDFDQVVALFPDGGWLESVTYYWTALNMVKYLEALHTATGGRLDPLELGGNHYRRWLEGGAEFLLYTTMPDASLLRWNDADEIPGASDDHRLTMMWVASRIGDPLAALYAAYCDSVLAPLASDKLPYEILWRSDRVRQAELVAGGKQLLRVMPLWKHFRSLGLVIQRTGWFNPDAAVVAFHCGDSYGYHMHYDQNHFSIWCAGPLLLDSGSYNGGWRHQNNYNVRTLAHNTLLVTMPKERFDWTERGYNEGGQRRIRYPRSASEFLHYLDTGSRPDQGGGDRHYNTGDVVAESLGGSYLLRGLAQDASLPGGPMAYRPEKLRYFCRHLAWLEPGRWSPELIVLFDEVTLAARFRADSLITYPCRWALHTAAKPRSGAQTVSAVGVAPTAGFRIAWDAPQGLCMQGLLSGTPVQELVGGPGKRFWAASTATNYADGGYSYTDAAGHWRVEISASEQPIDQYLLSVVSFKGPAEPDVSFIGDPGEFVGVAIGQPWQTAVLFVSRKGLMKRTFAVPPVRKILLGNLKPECTYELDVLPRDGRSPRARMSLVSSPGGWLCHQLPCVTGTTLTIRSRCSPQGVASMSAGARLPGE
jgi:hypothetical protein